jgi:hypothetical protein
MLRRATFGQERRSDGDETGGAGASGGIVRQSLVLIALVSTIVFNGVANYLPLNDRATGEIADQFPVYFVPAGYVFSIWGVIYLGLAAYAVYQALPSQRFNPRLQRIAYPFVLTCIANMSWLFFWHYGFVALSLVAMVTLLVLLIVIYAMLYPHFPAVSAAERWLVHVPFRIYLGWITVATIANATTLLYDLNWGGWGISGPVWAAIMTVIGGGLALFFSLRLRDAAYSLVIVWAFVGLYVKFSDTPVVGWTALVVAAIVAVSILVGIWRGRSAAPDQDRMVSA